MFNQIKTVLLLGFLTGILLAIGAFFGGQTGILTAFGFAVVINISAYYFSDKIVLKIYKAKPEALLIKVPLIVFPKNEDTSGNT